MARRDTLTASFREAASVTIAARVIAIAEEWEAGVRGREASETREGIVSPPRAMAVYMPIRSEVALHPAITWALDEDVRLALPVVVDATTIVFRRYDTGDVLQPGRFGTVAPSADAEPVDPELMILPMVAFDRTGTRLGHGRGFYDRAIARLHAKGIRPTLVGVAFSAQEVADIPAEPHDMRMDIIVTERETLVFRKG
jgi:5-formyltetrahydrofolate cyclo-ligase